MNSNLANQLDRTMTPEQFNQVVSAILDGKYSWACLLILQFAGYNPLHYIPYRTYNRLMKENKPGKQSKNSQTQSHSDSHSSENLSIQDCISRLEDLGYLETLPDSSKNLQGGSKWFWSNRSWLTSFSDRF